MERTHLLPEDEFSAETVNQVRPELDGAVIDAHGVCDVFEPSGGEVDVEQGGKRRREGTGRVSRSGC